MALFVSGELISVLCFVCEFEADRIFVARDFFEVLGQNTSVFFTLRRWKESLVFKASPN